MEINTRKLQVDLVSLGILALLTSIFIDKLPAYMLISAILFLVVRNIRICYILIQKTLVSYAETSSDSNK